MNVVQFMFDIVRFIWMICLDIDKKPRQSKVFDNFFYSSERLKLFAHSL